MTEQIIGLINQSVRWCMSCGIELRTDEVYNSHKEFHIALGHTAIPIQHVTKRRIG
jgi:hypothetical protein